MSIFNLFKFHFLTKTQYDELTNKSSNEIFLVDNERFATSLAEISTTKPATVIEASYSSSSWYRKWSDGWIEQGGKVNVTVSESVSVTYPLEMVNLPSFLNCNGYNQPTDGIEERTYLVNTHTVTNTGFMFRYYDADAFSPYWCKGYVSWEVNGY